MGVDDIISEQPAYQQARQQRADAQTTETSAGTIQINIDPLTSYNRQTIEFWLLVTQTVLLAYIAWKL